MNYVRLPLEGAKNVRDLGGYPTKDGKITRFKIFVRSNRLKLLTQKDQQFLKDYGITDIIDLRGKLAIQNIFVSDDNVDKNYFNHYHIPLNNKNVEDHIEETVYKDDFDFGESYYLFLESVEKIKKIFSILENAKGGVLFHCTAGKDRTGVVAALILGLCGVEDSDIIANYEITNTYIEQDGSMDNYEERMKLSRPEFMKTFLNLVKSNYGSMEEYLIKIGITRETIDNIKNKFCEKIN